VLNLRQLEATREQALRAMGLALEYRDLETKGHTDRVTRMVLKLGQKLGLNNDELAALRWGAYLHDIGKIGIPDQVLLKPGKLLPEDWVTMKTHVLIGEEMALGLGFVPKPVLEIIRSHHERWSGQGYPDQRAAEEIPLLARIFTLADVFDALLSSRPYKNPWPLAKAVREIEVNIGVQFDPEIAPAFLEIVRDLRNP
jgi:putative nucleotidyltransferase with HDIG domain